MDKEYIFFSRDNLDMIYMVLKEDINSRFNYNLDNEDRDFKTQLFNTMSKVYTENKNKDLKLLNKYVIQESAPNFIEKITSLYKNQSLNLSKNTIRDSDIINKQHDLIKKTSVNLRPESNSYNRDEITAAYDNITKIRSDETNRPLLVKDDFELQNDTNIDPEEMEQTLQKVINERNDGRKTNKIEKTTLISDLNQSNDSRKKNQIEKTTLISDLKNSIDENQITYNVNQLNNSEYQSNLSFMDERNNESRAIIDQNSEKNPSDLYKKNEEQNTIMESIYKDKQSKEVNQLDILIPDTDIKYHKKNNWISISSKDRDWINDKNSRFNYTVFFNPSSDNWDKVPIYQNNKTKPQNHQQYEKGILGDINDTGWTDDNGNIYDKYDMNKPEGDIVGYDTIVIKGNNNLKINTIYRNIYSIELVNVFIPVEDIYLSHDTTVEINIYSYPYLILNISEFSGIYNSTDDKINSSFCKLIIDSNIKTNNNHRGFEKFISSANEKKIFFPKPLESLTKLSLQLLTPMGEELSYQPGVYEINNLSFSALDSGINNMYIKIVIKKYFSVKILQKTDLILLKNIQINNSVFSNNMDLREVRDKFISYLEKPSGHRVIEIKNSDINSYKCSNTFYINNNGKLNYDTGQFELDDYECEQSWVCYQPFLDILPNCAISGKFININLQNSYTFTITTNDIDYKYSM